jgi:hypothetical protein
MNDLNNSEKAQYQSKKLKKAMTSGINEFEEQAYKQLNEFRGYKKTTN